MQPYGNWQWWISLLLGASIITGIIYCNYNYVELNYDLCFKCLKMLYTTEMPLREYMIDSPSEEYYKQSL